MREFSFIKENILKYLEFKGVSKYEFYQKTGISNGVLSQKNGFSEDNILKFLSYYSDINLDWLFLGNGEMIKKIDSNLKVYEPSEVYPKGSPLNKSIPLVSITAVGGFGNSNFTITDQDVKDYYVVPKFKHKQIDFMIEVEGSSMYPKYNSGDIVACRIISEKGFIQWNKTHVIATKNQGIIIKRIKPGNNEMLTMISDNKDFDPFTISVDEIEGIAIVVGLIRLE